MVIASMILAGQGNRMSPTGFVISKLSLVENWSIMAGTPVIPLPDGLQSAKLDIRFIDGCGGFEY